MEPRISHLLRKSQTEYNTKPQLSDSETSNPRANQAASKQDKEKQLSSKTEEVTIRYMKPNPDQTEQKKKPEQTILELSILQAV